MVEITADMHLKRALGFIEVVERATEDFRNRAINYTDQMNTDQPFLQGMLDARRGSKQLQQQKASLVNDLQLADQEVDRAVRLDGAASLETKDGPINAVLLRSSIMFMSGQLEMIWGNNHRAKDLFNASIQIMEIPDAHYMLGLVCESEYNQAEALRHFERCLELDPAGELSVGALREANAMRNYRKRFRGSWGLVLLLLVFFFPAAFLYFFVKRK